MRFQCALDYYELIFKKPDYVCSYTVSKIQLLLWEKKYKTDRRLCSEGEYETEYCAGACTPPRAHAGAAPSLTWAHNTASNTQYGILNDAKRPRSPAHQGLCDPTEHLGLTERVDVEMVNNDP